MHKLRCDTKVISINPTLVSNQISRSELHAAESKWFGDEIQLPLLNMIDDVCARHAYAAITQEMPSGHLRKTPRHV